MLRRSSLWTCLTLFSLVACGDDGSDGSRPDASTDECAGGCDDGVFCNGEERCVDGRCEAGSRPCGGGVCDEEARTCPDCEDADGDGAASIECGGTDCDDTDPNRFPGNPEVCDADDVDEDCDPTTFGRRDIDGDDLTSADCCNGDNCGTDCDDNRATVGPTSPEVCNEIDDDCDGAIDEGVGETFYEDADGDGFGVAGGATRIACVAPEGFAPNDDDCDDSNTGINPGVGEACDAAGVDENCDGEVNPESLCDCEAGDPPRPCEREGVCANGTEMCVRGMWNMCSIAPVTEVCNGLDDDCNGAIDDRFLCAQGSSEACNVCGQTGSRTCRAGCAGFGACEATEQCNDCDDDSDGVIDEDFDCRIGSTVSCVNACGNPGQATCGASCTLDGACVAAEACDYCDDDGDGTSDDETPMATVDGTVEGVVCADYLRGGDTICSGNSTSSSTAIVEPGDDVGGAWLTAGQRLGYRALDFEFRMSFETSFVPGQNPTGGVAYILSDQPTTSANRVGTTANGGAPSRRSLIAFHELTGMDRIRILQRSGSGTDEIITCAISNAAFRLDQGETANMRLRLRYTPANTSTGTAASLALFACNASADTSCTPNTRLGCEGTGVTAFAVDTPLYAGVTAGFSAHTPYAWLASDGVILRAGGRCE